MQITTLEIKSLLSKMGFSDSHSKRYDDDNLIKVDFENKKIIYPDAIKKGDESTSNFSSSENFVVLECVDRLLSLGYNANSIILDSVVTRLV